VGNCCGVVCVGCQVVKFCKRAVRTLGHGVLLGCSMQTETAFNADQILIVRMSIIDQIIQ
jgi:hypothetical protein